jgi:hypothetical protein
MSKLNGDKARFQRLRKATLLRRLRSRRTLAGLLAHVPDAQAGSTAVKTGGAAARPPKPRRSGRSLERKAETV